MAPSQPMWVTIPYWRDDINDVDFERHPVVAIRSTIEYVYEGDNSNEIAPHYSELVKKGWTFMRTEISHDVLFCDSQNFKIRASADLVEVRIIHAIHTGDRTSNEANAASKLVCAEFRERRGVDPDFKPDSTLDEIITQLKSDGLGREQYTYNIKQLLHGQPNLKLSGISSAISRSDDWVCKTLQLDRRLNTNMLSDVKRGKLCVANAYIFSKLPLDEQGEHWTHEVYTYSPDQLVQLVNTRLREIKNIRRDETRRMKADCD